MPGFTVNDTYQASTWNWTTYVEMEIDTSFNSSDVWQTIALETSPIQNLSDAANTPYTACIFAFMELNGSALNKGEKDDGTCSSVFGSDCVLEITQLANTTAASISGRDVASISDCNTIFKQSSLSDKCSGLWTQSGSTQFMSGNFTDFIPYRSDCPLTNPGDTNNTDPPFFSWSQFPEGTATVNYTSYDQSILFPQSILVTAWLKQTDSSLSSSNGVQSDYQAWADTRLLCIPANNTTPGSWTLKDAQAAQSAEGLGSSSSTSTSTSTSTSSSSSPTGTQKSAALRVDGAGMAVFAGFVASILLGFIG